MNKQQLLLNEAKNTVLIIKKDEFERVKQKSNPRINLTPFASFSDQVIRLIGDGKVQTRAHVIEYTGLVYPRSQLKRQWILFGRVLEKNMRMNWDTSEMLFYFGYLKRLLTIEGKKKN